MTTNLGRTMSVGEARAILMELARRTQTHTLLDAAFPVQKAFLNDPSKLKAALTSRRSGKSYGIGLWLLDGAIKNPGTNQLYIALTRESAKRILLKDVLQTISHKYNLPLEINKSTLEVRLQNNSVIHLLGADADRQEAEKILGQKYYRVAIDECASYRIDLQHLIYATIKPTLTDLRGELALIGTPGNHKNFFYEITTGKVPGWSVHKWSAKDNPHIATQFAEEIAELTAANPNIASTPLFKQHYLGEWITDTTKIVYAYDPSLNDITSLPSDVMDYVFVMGIDLGYNDSTALTLTAYNPHSSDKTLYIIKSKKKAKQTVSQVAEWIQSWANKFPINQYITDPASKQVVEELRQRYHLPLEPADKLGKVEAIALMNSDFIAGNIKILKTHCIDLINELTNLIWDERQLPKYVELSSTPNDCTDSCLYAWRHTQQYLAKPKVQLLHPYNIIDDTTMEQYEEQIERQQQQKPWWESNT